jgi:hypothetical protein
LRLSNGFGARGLGYEFFFCDEKRLNWDFLGET